MSNESLVLIDRRSDGVAVVTLNSPKVNALSTALLARLHDVASELASSPAGAVVITGGDRLFAAGADISEFGGPSEAKTIGSPFFCAIENGTISSLNLPASCAAAALVWLASARASCMSRVIPYFLATFSAVMPMWYWL